MRGARSREFSLVARAVASRDDLDGDDGSEFTHQNTPAPEALNIECHLCDRTRRNNRALRIVPWSELMPKASLAPFAFLQTQLDCRYSVFSRSLSQARLNRPGFSGGRVLPEPAGPGS